MNNVQELARHLYDTYCRTVGGVAFNGDPLPTWDEFCATESKKKQVDGWKAVASEATIRLVAPQVTTPANT